MRFPARKRGEGDEERKMSSHAAIVSVSAPRGVTRPGATLESWPVFPLGACGARGTVLSRRAARLRWRDYVASPSEVPAELVVQRATTGDLFGLHVLDAARGLVHAVPCANRPGLDAVEYKRPTPPDEELRLRVRLRVRPGRAPTRRRRARRRRRTRTGAPRRRRRRSPRTPAHRPRRGRPQAQGTACTAPRAASRTSDRTGRRSSRAGRRVRPAPPTGSPRRSRRRRRAAPTRGKAPPGAPHPVAVAGA